MRSMDIPASTKIPGSTTTTPLPGQRTMKTPVVVPASPTLRKQGGRRRGGGGYLLSSLGMQLSGSVAVLIIILFCLIYSFWDSHRLHHLLDSHEEFIVTIDRVVDGDTFVGTVEDTYTDANDDGDDGEAVPMGSVGVDDGVCVPVACERRQRNQPELGIGASEMNCCRRKPRLVVRGGLTAWFRLRRIDAPEMTGGGGGEGGGGGGGQPFSLQAKRALEGLLIEGTPLLPSEHTANSMMLQAAHRLDNPIFTATAPTSAVAAKKKMSRTDLAKSQFITLPIWKNGVDDDHHGLPSSSSSNTRSTPRQASSSSLTSTISTVTVSVRIVEQDKSGRYVVDAFVQASPLGSTKSRLWASYEMVRAGYAWGYSSSTPSPSFSTRREVDLDPQRRDERGAGGSEEEEEELQPITVSVAEAFMDPLVVAMRAAKNEGRGLWGRGEQPPSVIVEPWRWRVLSANKKKLNIDDSGASTTDHRQYRPTVVGRGTSSFHQSNDNSRHPHQDGKTHDLSSAGGGRQNGRRSSGGGSNRRHRHKSST